MQRFWKQSILVGLWSLGASSLYAQSFAPQTADTQAPTVANVQLPEELAVTPPTNPVNNEVQPSVDAAGRAKPGEPFIPNQPEVSIFERPTLDGVARGYMSINRLDEKGKEVDPTKDTAQIFLFYQNFEIERTVTGRITCNVRFVVNTNLDSKLISLAVKLVWPEISTNLSFINVPPNTPTYFDYTLMGNGCYSMDKYPNIVVNRCRIKGLSASECAAKIVWLKDTK